MDFYIFHLYLTVHFVDEICKKELADAITFIKEEIPNRIELEGNPYEKIFSKFNKVKMSKDYLNKLEEQLKKSRPVMCRSQLSDQ